MNTPTDDPDVHALGQQIITLCQTPHTALQAVHLLYRAGRATQAVFLAVYDRTMCDCDVHAAYYLVNFALQIDDLPYDGRPLVEMIMRDGDEAMRQKLSAKLPLHWRE